MQAHRPVDAPRALVVDGQPVFAQSVMQFPKAPARMPPRQGPQRFLLVFAVASCWGVTAAVQPYQRTRPPLAPAFLLPSPALPGAAPQGGLLSSQNLLDGLVLQTQVREHLLEPPIFLFQVLKSGQFCDARPGVLTFPAVKRGLAQAVLAHNLGHGLPAQLSLQNRDNLRFAESSFSHGSVVE